MTRIPKDYIEGALYYVSARGDHNGEIFKEQSDYKAYVELLKKYKKQYGFKLFSFVLLSNHLHLLFELKHGLTISNIMHDLNANYTKYFNSKYKRKGHLFQERGKVVLAEKETYLLSLVAYMHLNPLSLKLTTAIGGYAYSSHILYAGIHLKDSIFEGLDLNEEINGVLEKISFNRQGGQPEKQSFYINFIKYVPQEQMDNLSKESAKKQILGSENFLHRVQQKMEEKELVSSAAGAEINGYRKKIVNQQNLVFAGSAAVILMGLLTFYLYNRGLGLKENLKKELEKGDWNLSSKLNQERKMIARDLQEKYQADMVSYQAMAKRLEIEKRKARELEEKLK